MEVSPYGDGTLDVSDQDHLYPTATQRPTATRHSFFFFSNCIIKSCETITRPLIAADSRARVLADWTLSGGWGGGGLTDRMSRGPTVLKSPAPLTRTWEEVGAKTCRTKLADPPHRKKRKGPRQGTEPQTCLYRTNRLMTTPPV